MNKPFFTVVIPTYNRADLLPLSIESVLKQNFQDFEIIVVDNCSSDNTTEVMQQYQQDLRVRYFRNEQDMERAYSRNVGLSNATGSFLTLLDSDDVMYADCLQDAFEFAKAHTTINVFHNLYEMIDQQGRPTKQNLLPRIKNQHKQLCRSNFLSCIGVFLSREVYQQFRFNEDLKMIGSEDYEIWFRVLGHYEVARINKINCGVRQHVGRSVFSRMYENLEYQRLQLLKVVKDNSFYFSKYKNYLGALNANYFYHQAMYSLDTGHPNIAFRQFVSASMHGSFGFVFSRRFAGFLKNYLQKKFQ